jgi:hypothetical protein
MDEGILLFNKVKPNLEFINEIFEYDVRKLEATDGVVISKYSIALAQYLIFFQAEVNRTKLEIVRKQRILDGAINQLLNDKLLKQHKTKAAAKEHIIYNSKEFSSLKSEIEKFRDELTLIDGEDKKISELIAVFKRELTRREKELYTVRKERYS